MKWAIVWKPNQNPKGKWTPWTDRLFNSRTQAWNAVFADRGWTLAEDQKEAGLWKRGRGAPNYGADVVGRAALIKRNQRLGGLRVVPAWIEHLDPDRYAATQRQARRKK